MSTETFFTVGVYQDGHHDADKVEPAHSEKEALNRARWNYCREHGFRYQLSFRNLMVRFGVTFQLRRSVEVAGQLPVAISSPHAPECQMNFVEFDDRLAAFRR
jgi:hypothetical protein